MDLIVLTEILICGFIFIIPLIVEIFNDRKEKIIMKIIFDNEEQKKKFMGFLACADNICPFEIGLHEDCWEQALEILACDNNVCPSNIGLLNDCRGMLCARCWEQALEIEVKEKKDE